jgi:hypothetical protein
VRIFASERLPEAPSRLMKSEKNSAAPTTYHPPLP